MHPATCTSSVGGGFVHATGVLGEGLLQRNVGVIRAPYHNPAGAFVNHQDAGSRHPVPRCPKTQNVVPGV